MRYNISVDSLESMDSPSKAHRCELAGFAKAEEFLYRSSMGLFINILGPKSETLVLLVLSTE